MSSAMTISLKVTQASLNQTAMDFPRNMANIYAAIDEAASQGSDVLALEELTITGYDCGDDFQKTDNDKIESLLRDIAAYAHAKNPNLIISVGHPWRLQMRDIPKDGVFATHTKHALYDRMNKPFNVQSLIVGGKVAGITAKTNLYNDGRGYEDRYFSQWDMEIDDRVPGNKHFGTLEISFGDEKVLFGRPIIQVTDGTWAINIAQAICEEKWVATRFDGAPYTNDRYAKDNIIPMISDAAEGQEGLLLLIANASPPSPLKLDSHVELDKLAASKYAEVVVDTDGVGSSGSTFAQFGHRLVVVGDEVLSSGHRLGFGRVQATTSTVPISAFPYSDESVPHDIALKHDFTNAAQAPAGTLAWLTAEGAWDAPENMYREAEESIRMTALWLFDYMRKNKTRGIMEALSGGADSAFNCVMVSATVRLGFKDLGVEGFFKEMKHLPYKNAVLAAYKSGGEEAAYEECMRHMLSTVYMGTSNSSDETKEAARFLIEGDANTKGIGGVHKNRNVQDMLDFYAFLFAVEDTTQIDPVRKEEMFTEVKTFLNLKPGLYTREELDKKQAEIKEKYPEITALVSAAYPEHTVAYENIQARARQVLVMMMANVEGKMAIANPNLDEARNAYATFGGDLHSGTINLNAHLPKEIQIGLMHYMMKHGLMGVMDPIEALKKVMANKPTAELMPKDANGKVIQNDEDALQRTFAQMNYIAKQMLYVRMPTRNGERRYNATEVFSACLTDEGCRFDGADIERVYSMVAFSYERWGISQHKIHASAIGPTYGQNVDHQVSLRTPNLSGNSKDEIVELGIDVLAVKMAISDDQISLLKRRSRQDEDFVEKFMSLLKQGKRDLSCDLSVIEQAVREKGWEGTFGEPPEYLKVLSVVRPSI
ncbi:MAG: hypothetical protein GC136_01630 [Alphaproteobacteria bacterium]|nr:hypothetical protein [Alphaproteobacteria bacterium]